jgi:periplasmic divalent cation tolerance protein
MDPVDATGPMRLVLCAFPADGTGARIARTALERKLAACAQELPIHSQYWWKGTVEAADETLVVFKTVPKRVGALFRFLASAHPYDVPEIVEIDVPRVHEPYLSYLAGTIDPDAPPLPLGGGRRGARATRSGSRRARAVRRPGRTRAPRRPR